MALRTPCLLLLLASAGVHAQSAQERLQRFGTGLRTAATSFQQVVTGPNGEPVQTARGTLELQAPDRFRWEYTAPNKQWVIADGKQIMVYEPDLKQVTVRAQDALAQDNPLGAISKPELLSRYYTIGALPDKHGLAWLQLLPKNAESSPFDKAWLGFDADGLRSMRLFDGLGQVSEFTFGDWRRNIAIDPKRFTFKAPKGVDIVQ